MLDFSYLATVGVLDVHLVPEESQIFRYFLEVLGPLLIAGAAVFAAHTARKSAAERQEKQLLHDTERQEETLAHDRKMRDRESTRRVIDQAIEAANNILALFLDWEGYVENIQKDFKTSEKNSKGDPLKQEHLERIDEAVDAVTDIGFHSLRLHSRPGAEVVADVYQELVENYRKHRVALTNGMLEELDESQVEEIESIDKDGTQIMGRTLEAWRQWLDDATG